MNRHRATFASALALLPACSALFGQAVNYSIQTFAGNASIGDGGPAANALLGYPFGLVQDSGEISTSAKPLRAAYASLSAEPSPPTPAGVAGSITAVPNTLRDVVVTLGGRTAEVEFAGLATGAVGLHQINIVVPAGLSGDALLGVSVGGVALAQQVYVALAR